MLVEMKPTDETINMVCGGCKHAFSSHKITVDTKISKVYGNCKICSCSEISDG